MDVTPGHVLTERHENRQTPSRPSGVKHTSGSNPSQMMRKSEKTPLKRLKSSSNLTSVFSRLNRSNRDGSLSPRKNDEKENAAPKEHSRQSFETPIWAQYATTLDTSQAETHVIVKEPSAANKLDCSQSHPKFLFDRAPWTADANTTACNDLHTRPVQDVQTTLPHTDQTVSSLSRSQAKREDGVAGDTAQSVESRASSIGSNHLQIDKKISVTKRGGRVMAAVAALQGKSKSTTIKLEEDTPDPAAIDEAFEEVLESRNIPEPMRRKMRALTLRVKTDFVKQNRDIVKIVASPANGQDEFLLRADEVVAQSAEPMPSRDQEVVESKRARTRSRTFTFSKLDRSNDGSPSKKLRSRSKSGTRPLSIDFSRPTSRPQSMAGAPRVALDSETRRTVAPSALPQEYIQYLQDNRDPVQMEVGRVHKLRILLRNETVSWVNEFLLLGGMEEIAQLLHRIMRIEWREDHEDQLLHETLLCLKGLCTTDRAMCQLQRIADDLFPALIKMIFDPEKKGPAEYATRGVVFNILFNYLASVCSSASLMLEQRARSILSYLGLPVRQDDIQPVDFILDMHTPRPYKPWAQEMTNVTKEVFWIFLHQTNVVPLPGSEEQSSSDCSLATNDIKTFAERHFPGSRPPVPAAPYVGGVEWDATTYLAAHLDLQNGILASLPDILSRNELRKQLKASGFEKLMGGTLRTCKEKFYGAVHDGLRAWVKAAHEDGWPVQYVREGPTIEEQVSSAKCEVSKKKIKKQEKLPNIEPVAFNIGLELRATVGIDDGWLE